MTIKDLLVHIEVLLACPELYEYIPSLRVLILSSLSNASLEMYLFFALDFIRVTFCRLCVSSYAWWFYCFNDANIQSPVAANPSSAGSGTASKYQA